MGLGDELVKSFEEAAAGGWQQCCSPAAQQIIKTLALPVLSRASELPRPMPLSHLPRLPHETSMLYTIGRVDPSGRITNRGITDAVRWQPGDRLAMTLTPSAVVFCPAPDGLLRVPPSPFSTRA